MSNFNTFISDNKPPTGVSVAGTYQKGVYNVYWNAPQGSTVDAYKVEYYDLYEENPSTIVLTDSAARQCTLDTKDSDPYNPYGVRVQAICGGQAGEWSQSVTVRNAKQSEFTCN